MTKEAPRDKSGEPPADERLVRIVQAFLGVMVALQVVYFLLYSWRMIVFPGQLDYGEGPILQIALRVARGQSLYPPLNQGYPYVIASYLPCYYLLSALALKITGPSFAGGRLISCLAALVIAVSVGLMVRERTKSRYAALVSGGTVLAIPVFVVWSTLMRIDMPALAFSVAGFYVFQRGRRLPGIALFALAVFTRWTNIAAIAAALVGLLLARKWKTAIGWGLAQLALIVALVVGANLVTHGNMYEQLRWHTSTSLGKSWTWAQVYDLLHKGWLHWPVYYVVSAVGTIWCLARRRHWTLGIWSVAAWVIYLTSGRIGSTYNYFLEPLAVGMACAGVLVGETVARTKVNPEQAAGLPRPLPQAGSLRHQPWAMALGLAVMGALALQMVRTDTGMNQTLQMLRPLASGKASGAVVERLRQAPGMVMCEDVGLIELAGKEVPFDPFELTMLSRAGAIDAGPVLRDVRAGRFSVFITRFDAEDLVNKAGDPGFAFIFDRFPMEMVRALVESYEPVGVTVEVGPRGTERRSRYQPYWVYVPKREMYAAGMSRRRREHALPYNSGVLLARSLSAKPWR